MDEWLIAEVNALSEPSTGFEHSEGGIDGMSVHDGSSINAQPSSSSTTSTSRDYLPPVEKRPKLEEFAEEHFDYLTAGGLFDGSDATATSFQQLDSLKADLNTYASASQVIDDGVDISQEKPLQPSLQLKQQPEECGGNSKPAEGQNLSSADDHKVCAEGQQKTVVQVQEKEEAAVAPTQTTSTGDKEPAVAADNEDVKSTTEDEKNAKNAADSGESEDDDKKTAGTGGDSNQKEQPKDVTKGKKKKKAEGATTAGSSTTAAAASASQNMRKNIRDILTDDKLESETLTAQREEMERKRRLQEIQQRAHQEMMANQAFLRQQERSLMAAGLMQQQQQQQHRRSGESIGGMHHGSALPPIRYGQHLGSSGGGVYSTTTGGVTTATPIAANQMRFRPTNDVIVVESSSSGASSDEESMNKSVIDISSSDSSDETSDTDSDSDDRDDDIVAVCNDILSDDDGKESEDPSNSGSHVNDTFNQPDASGRVLVNVGHPVEDPDIFLAPQLARVIKPHQIGGIRFLYDNIVESLSNWKTTNGFGCILAHSMGLGKTIQVVSFVDVFLRHTEARTVLIIVPINTLQNWIYEFNLWTPVQPQGQGGSSSSSSSSSSSAATAAAPTVSQQPQPTDAMPDASDVTGRLGEGEIRCRNYVVHALGDVHKTPYARNRIIRKWQTEGGVLLIGYEMYRIICSRKSNVIKVKRGRKGGAEPSVAAMVADMEEDGKNKELIAEMQQHLLKPDLVICDEGHRIKNCHASTSQALKNIKTKRRVVLTGYPLQNNLIEYWCMVDFVRPNFLGTKSEFCNMFERPIQNGQCVDSTPEDVRLMRYRAHVLHSLLEGFIQRRGHSVLRLSLPQKQEHVLLVRMTPIQRLLYSTFMQELLSRNTITNPIKAFSVCCKIWNHPDILYNCVRNLQSKGLDDDLDLEEAKVGGAQNGTSSTRRRGGNGRANNQTSGRQNFASSGVDAAAGTAGTVTDNTDAGGLGPPKERSSSDNVTGVISYDWAHSVLKDYRPGVLENGLKMVLMLQIIEQGLQAGDRILLFSQSLFTLSLIEELLGQLPVPYTDGVRWARNKNYFRLDGSTSSSDREKLINDFNSNEGIVLFLISTRAGSLGINLVGANRVIVFDASWNPCHDTQAVCRVYRYGQTKPCHVYRLVTDNSLEKKIYDRQINKQGISDRVVDELNPDVTLTMKEVSSLLVANECDPPIQDLSESASEYDDHVLGHLCTSMGHCLTRPPFEHESQLMDRKELKLTKMEKRLAKQSYEMDKRATVQFRYPRSDPFSMDFGHSGRPVANVRPMQFNNQRPSLMETLAKQGVTFKQINLANEVRIPAPDGKDEPIVIPAGQQVLIISSPTGVYLRCPNNKLVQIKPPGQQNDPPHLNVRNGIRPLGSRPLPALHNHVTVSANRTSGGMVEEAEVIDLSDEDDDIIVTSSAPPSAPVPSVSSPSTSSSMSFVSGRSVMSSGTNAYTAQNPGLLTGGLVLRNEPSSRVVSSGGSGTGGGQPSSVASAKPIVQATPSTSSNAYTEARRNSSSVKFDQLLSSCAAAAAVDGNRGSGNSGGGGVYGNRAYRSLINSQPQLQPQLLSRPTAAATVTATTATTNTNTNDMTLSAMDYLNKTLSTPSYNPYPPWSSTTQSVNSGGGGGGGGSLSTSSSLSSSSSSTNSSGSMTTNWSTMPVQNPSPAADQVAFVSSIRDLLIPAPSRLFPTPTSRPDVTTAPLSAKHLGDLYPHVLDATAAASVPTNSYYDHHHQHQQQQQHHHHHHQQQQQHQQHQQQQMMTSSSRSSAQ